jgi:hypothetical protein
MNTAESKYTPESFYRCVRGYAPHWRTLIIRAVTEKMELLGRPLTPEEIGECAVEIVLDEKSRVETMERICIEAYDAGKTKPLQDVIDELRSSLAGSGSL